MFSFFKWKNNSKKTCFSLGLFLLGGIAFLSLVHPPRAQARPPLLEAEEGCDLWRGVASGNDPSVRVELRLCREGQEISGELQWSSEESGWNRREIRGRWTSDTDMRLEDVRFIENRPNYQWRFCHIDIYQLRQYGADELVGTYRSNRCDDSARVNLRRVASESGAGRSPSSAGGEPDSRGSSGGGDAVDRGAAGNSVEENPAPRVREIPAPPEQERGFGICALRPGRTGSLQSAWVLILSAALLYCRRLSSLYR